MEQKNKEIINRIMYEGIRNEIYPISIQSFIDFVKLLINYTIFDKKYLMKIIELYSYKDIKDYNIDIIKLYNSIANTNLMEIVSVVEIHKIFKRTNYKCCNRNNKIIYKEGKIYTNYSGLLNLFCHLRTKKFNNTESSIRNISEIYKFCVYEYHNYKNNNRIYLMNKHINDMQKKLDSYNNNNFNNLFECLTNYDTSNDYIYSKQLNAISVSDTQVYINPIDGIDVESSYDYLYKYIDEIDKIF